MMKKDYLQFKISMVRLAKAIVPTSFILMMFLSSANAQFNRTISNTTGLDLDWQSVTYGNGLFAAVAWSGTGNRVMKSGEIILTPTITSFTPTSASTGSALTITGTNFTGATAVSFGETAATSFTVDNATQITAVVGAGTSGSVSVATSGGTATLAGFTFINGPSAQPTNLFFSNTKTGSNFNIVLNYTASASADGYLVVRKAGSAPTFVPISGTVYSAGAQGSDQIVYVGSAVTCTDAALTAATTYYYAIYAFKGSGSSTGYLTANSLRGFSTLYITASGGIASSGTTSASAGFPNAGVNVTFPGGTTGTTLTVNKTAAAPASNFSALPGVKGVKNLYFTITSSNATPGTYTLVMDFSGLGLTNGQWASFKVLKRTDAASAWMDVTTLGATIVSRQTDGVWGKFTISGLTSFSEFALGESFDGVIVSNLSEDSPAALEGSALKYNAQAFTTNGTRYDLTSATLSIFDNPSDARLKLYSALPDSTIGSLEVTFGSPALVSGDNYNFTPSSPASYTLQANTTYWLVFNSVGISDFNTTMSLAYSGAGTMPDKNNNAMSDDGGTNYTYYDDQPFVVAVNGNIIPTVITWNGSISTDWNTAANWDMNTVPTEYDLVTIPGNGVTDYPVVDQAIATPAMCTDLTIAMGGNISIEGGKALTVNGTLTNNAGVTGVIINSDAANGSGSLLHHTANVPSWFSTTITGGINLTDYKYHLVSVPLTPASNSTSLLFDGLYLYDFDVAGNAWNNLGNSTTIDLDETKGYMVYKQGTDVNLLFEGNLNAGEFTPTVINAGSGFNLVPNPYPSAIDWDAVQGWTKTNIGGSTWIWSAANGNYAAYNTVSGGTNNGTKYIPAGQAFFVQATGAPQLVMNDPVRVHSTQTFWKSAENPRDRLSIKVQANDYSDEAVVRFDDEATLYADPQLDAVKMPGLDSAPQLCTLTPDNEKLSINSLPHAAGSVTVPLNFGLKADKPATLTISGLESFSPDSRIYLEDKLYGTTINLRQQQTYTFTHLQTNAAGRFELHFNGTAGADDLNVGHIRIWAGDQAVNISAPALTGQNALVEVIGLSGQQACSRHVTLGDLTRVPVNLSGMYIIRVTTSEEVMVKKGFFR